MGGHQGLLRAAIRGHAGAGAAAGGRRRAGRTKHNAPARMRRGDGTTGAPTGLRHRVTGQSGRVPALRAVFAPAAGVNSRVSGGERHGVGRVQNGSAVDPAVDEGAGKCVVCLSRAVDTVCSPCGHAACCRSCIERIRKDREYGCPICRGRVLEILSLERVSTGEEGD